MCEILYLSSAYVSVRTPLHCAASCNNLPMVKFLVEHGACIFATTISDHETAAEKCEEDEDGYDGCSEYLYSKWKISRLIRRTDKVGIWRGDSNEYPQHMV